MKLAHGLHLAYCTNIHRGEDWPATLAALETHTLAVRRRVCPDRPYAIGLRLSDLAARQLAEPAALRAFRQWLAAHDCYVFTINGFPFGRFHDGRVKEQVALPDWTAPERLAYTNRLFDLLAELLPEGVAGSVSTVPVTLKEFRRTPRELRAAREQLWRCVEHQEALGRRTGRRLHLGLEPEPLFLLEDTAEFVAFFEQLQADRPGDQRLREHLGINYDCCHLAIEFEPAAEALERLHRAGVRLSKLHLSNALRVQPSPDARRALQAFADDTYFHQVIERRPDGALVRHRDLPEALATHNHLPPPRDTEWRVHFHIPLHAQPTALFDTTADHVAATLDWLRAHPGACQHLEMETYTWEVMPPELKQRSVTDQLAAEYAWTLVELGRRRLA